MIARKEAEVVERVPVDEDVRDLADVETVAAHVVEHVIHDLDVRTANVETPGELFEFAVANGEVAAAHPDSDQIILLVSVERTVDVNILDRDFRRVEDLDHVALGGGGSARAELDLPEGHVADSAHVHVTKGRGRTRIERRNDDRRCIRLTRRLPREAAAQKECLAAFRVRHRHVECSLCRDLDPTRRRRLRGRGRSRCRRRLWSRRRLRNRCRSRRRRTDRKRKSCRNLVHAVSLIGLATASDLNELRSRF